MRRDNMDVWKITIGRSFLTNFLSHRPVYCLPIRSDQLLCIYGLMISPTYTDHGEYVRLGAFSAWGTERRDLILAPAEKLPETAYEECDESRDLLLYTIKIV